MTRTIDRTADHTADHTAADSADQCAEPGTDDFRHATDRCQDQ